MSELDAVVAAAEDLAAATARVKSAVAAARAAGIEVTAIASAADVTRQTVYRWAAESTSTPAVHVRRTLDAALAAMIAYSPTASGSLAHALTSHDPRVKVRRLRLAVSNLATTDELSEEDREAVQLALLVAADITRREGGTIPTWVRLDA